MIGEKIKILRKKHQLTQKELAGMLKVKQPSLNRWENGIKVPSIKTLKKLTKIFDVSLDTLAFSKEDMKAAKINDKPLFAKMQEIELLSDNEQATVFNLIHALAEKYTSKEK